MAEKGFGVKEINLIGASGTPTIESPNNLNLNAVNVAISTNVSIGGTLSVTGNVSVGGTLTYEDVTNIDSVGIITARTGIKVLAGGINAVGVVTATSFSGDGSALTGISGGGFSPDAQGNLVAGTNAGANFSGTDPVHNILMGYETGNALTTADYNVAIGYEALNSADTESYNVAIGYKALKELTGMGSNVAIGYRAAYYTYNMYECVAVGYDAMSKPVQSGDTWYSVAVGANAMSACGGDRCTAVGHEALEGNNAATADDNTAIGHQSLKNLLQSGLKNTAVGTFSGKGTTSGDENIYIGYNAGNNAHTTGDNCIIIGSDAAASSASASNEVSIGNTSITKFRIPGIGVTFTSTTKDIFADDGKLITGSWTVTASGTSHFVLTGYGGVSNANDPTVYLARGQTYEFIINSGGSHPFQIRTGNQQSAYTTGVTYFNEVFSGSNSATSGIVRFEVPFSAPNVLVYQCTSHSDMMGIIAIYPST